MITINNINSIFKDIAKIHLQINEIFIGQDYDISTEKREHSILVVNPIGSVLPKTNNGYTYQTVDYSIKVLDLVDKDLNNQQEVLSDTLNIIKDVVKLLNQNPAYNDLGLNIVGDVNFNSLDGVFDTDVTGWETSFTLEFADSLGFCNLPFDGFTPIEKIDYVTITDGENENSPIEVKTGGNYTCISLEPKNGIAYLRDYNTFQTISYAVYDDGWQFQNNGYNYVRPDNPVYIAELDLLADTSGYTLKENNFFGNKHRFTDVNGNLPLPINGQYIIDNLTGLGYWDGTHPKMDWNSVFGVGGALENFNTSLIGGYNDFFNVNFKTSLSIVQMDIYNSGVNESLILPFLKSANRNTWTSTTRQAESTQSNYLHVQGFYGVINKTTSSITPLYCRVHFK